jgi:eukaryotic-like serine/threonine-protein kinase
MPPEQFEGAPATPAADVYAATATFYQCLACRAPFDGYTVTELYEQHKFASVWRPVRQGHRLRRHAGLP